ncbi:SHOCT domain-containing protein [Sporosarcina koreensis]|uniref:SHOCT domain-containing protein n=1 Tax=Sporosarcina koreensis TaxID=334735 RepID=UPI00058B46AF|nr:SHOCT domain-containing protein [Sporosarcina koreensis]
MSWSVIGIFVLLITWGFTESLLFGAVLLVVCASLQLTLLYIRKNSRKSNIHSRPLQAAHRQFLAEELERIRSLRESGLLTEDEFTEQNRLLSSRMQHSYS